MTGGRSRTAAAAILAAVLAAAPLAGQEESWSLGGALTVRTFGTAAEGTGSTDFSYGSAETLETALRAWGSVLRGEVSLETALLTGAAAQAFAAAADLSAISSDTLYAPVSWTVPADVETILALRVRTAYVKWNAPGFALTLGRQVINYGKGAAWSPVDIFTETDYSGLSPVRRGSDAARLTVPLGTLSLFEAVAAPQAEPGEGAYALRLAGFFFDAVDGSLVGAWDGDNDGDKEAWILGGDAKVDLSFASLYADAALSLPQAGGEAVLRSAAGFDTSFGDFILACEYYYNGGGQSSDPLFPGAHNLYTALTWKAADYHTLAVSCLGDLEAGIVSLQTAWAWEIAQNGTLTAYVKTANGSFQAGAAAWSAQAGAQFEVRF